MASEKLLKRFRIHLEGRVELRMPLDSVNHFLGYVLGLVPMCIEPILKLGHFARALDLHVEFDVLREAGAREVAGSYQCLRTDDFELGMGDVGLRVKLALVVDPAFDLTAT